MSTSVCGRCKAVCDRTAIYSAKLIVSYGDADEIIDEHKERRILNDITMCNEEEVCPKHFQDIQNTDLTSGFSCIWVPSEAYSKFHRTYKDVVDKYGIYLDHTGHFVGTCDENGSYEAWKDVALTSYRMMHAHGKISDSQSKPVHGFFREQQKVQPLYEANHGPSGTVSQVRYSPYNINVSPAVNPSNTNDRSNHNNKAHAQPSQYIRSDELKSIFAKHQGPFDPDQRKQAKPKKNGGRWSYQEASLFLQLHEKFQYKSVRKAQKVLFNTAPFLKEMVQLGGFPNRGPANWQSAHTQFFNGRHALLNRTTKGHVLNDDTNQVEWTTRPTDEALALKIQANAIQKAIDERRLKKHPLQLSGNKLLPNAQASFAGNNETNPIIAGLNDHQSYQENKKHKKDSYLALKQQEFDWKQKQAERDLKLREDDAKQTVQLIKVIGQLGTTDEDRKEHLKLCKWVNTQFIVQGDSSAESLLSSIRNNPSEYLLTWQIYEGLDKVKMRSKLTEIFDKLDQ